MGINYAPGLAGISDQHAPAIYLVEGRSAGSQIAVFGSQPGETDYSPLWHEVVIRWKSSVKPKLLTSDNQILTLAKHHKLTMHSTHIIGTYGRGLQVAADVNESMPSPVINNRGAKRSDRGCSLQL